VGILRWLWEMAARAYAAVYWRLTGRLLRRARYEAIEIEIAGALPEHRAPGSPFEFRRPARLTHRRLIELLDFAAADPRLKTIIVRLGPLTVGLARLQEVARALDRVKAAGKTLVAHLDSVGLREYVLAARCQRRLMTPTAVLALTGLNMEITYLRGLLDKADVEADLLVAGKFKSAAEMFTRTSAGEASHAMTEGLLDDLYTQLVADVATALGKSPAQVAKLIDGGPYAPERAVKAGLVDKLAYRDEMLAELGVKDERRLVPGLRYWRLMERRERARARMIAAPTLALVHLSGAIRDGRGDPASGRPGADSYVKLLRRLRRDKRVKAVVLRIASPGGAAGGSDLIRREAANLAAEKPLVVSMGDVAASGGYMAAVAGRTILAEPATLTGSIGVIAGKFAVAGLLAKLGVNVEAHRRGAAAGIFSGLGRFSALERRRMTEVLGAAYSSFKEAVAAGRKMTAERVDEIAEGRVWTGREALEHKLVDKLGGLAEALAEAKNLAGCAAGEPARWIEFPQPLSPWRLLRSFGAVDAVLPALTADSPLAMLDEMRALAAGPYAGLPFRIRVK